MKTIRAVLTVACLSLPACYDFDFPLDPKPVVPVDPRLVGTWRCLGAQGDSDDAPGLLRVARRSETLARWSFESRSADGTPEKDEYEVYGSTVPGGNLLNAQELGEKASGKWSFVRYSFLLPTVLRVQAIDDEPLAKVKGAAVSLRREIEKRRDDPAIYTDFLICVRAKEPASSPAPSPKAGL